MKNYTSLPVPPDPGDPRRLHPLPADLPRPALRPWQRYLLTAALIHLIGSIVIHSMATAQGANAVTALAVVAIALAAQLIADAIILAIAGRMGRL